MIKIKQRTNPVKIEGERVMSGYGYMRIVEAFDKDAVAHQFIRDDGEGGFASGVYRMAREIEQLRAVKAELVEALKAAVDQLIDLDSRFRKCADLGEFCSAREAYDSFYQSNVAEIMQQARAAIAKAIDPVEERAS